MTKNLEKVTRNIIDMGRLDEVGFESGREPSAFTRVDKLMQIHKRKQDRQTLIHLSEKMREVAGMGPIIKQIVLK